MTEIAPDAFPQQDEPEETRRQKALALVRTPREIVSGPALRLRGARVLYELGDISREQLQRYERAARA